MTTEETTNDCAASLSTDGLGACEQKSEGGGITEAQYAAAIPACCEYQTFEEHRDGLMLCWGLVSAIERGLPMNCDRCELNLWKAPNAGG